MRERRRLRRTRTESAVATSWLVNFITVGDSKGPTAVMVPLLMSGSLLAQPMHSTVASGYTRREQHPSIASWGETVCVICRGGAFVRACVCVCVWCVCVWGGGDNKRTGVPGAPVVHRRSMQQARTTAPRSRTRSAAAASASRAGSRDLTFRRREAERFMSPRADDAAAAAAAAASGSGAGVAPNALMSVTTTGSVTAAESYVVSASRTPHETGTPMDTRSITSACLAVAVHSRTSRVTCTGRRTIVQLHACPTHTYSLSLSHTFKHAKTQTHTARTRQRACQASEQFSDASSDE